MVKQWSLVGVHVDISGDEHLVGWNKLAFNLQGANNISFSFFWTILKTQAADDTAGNSRCPECMDLVDQCDKIVSLCGKRLHGLMFRLCIIKVAYCECTQRKQLTHLYSVGTQREAALLETINIQLQRQGGASQCVTHSFL